MRIQTCVFIMLLWKPQNVVLSEIWFKSIFHSDNLPVGNVIGTEGSVNVLRCARNCGGKEDCWVFSFKQGECMTMRNITSVAVNSSYGPNNWIVYQKCGCDKGWSFFDGSCYLYVQQYLDWATSSQYCKDLKGHLVSVTSADEDNFLHQYMQERMPHYPLNNYWIGANDIEMENSWTWSSGETFTYTNWNRDEPNNKLEEEDCVVAISGGWNDGQCNKTKVFVCEREMVSCA